MCVCVCVSVCACVRMGECIDGEVSRELEETNKGREEADRKNHATETNIARVNRSMMQ